jgi:hypothetical protein
MGRVIASVFGQGEEIEETSTLHRRDTEDAEHGRHRELPRFAVFGETWASRTNGAAPFVFSSEK